MATHRLSSNHRVSAPAFAVVAAFEPSEQPDRPFVRHVGLLAGAADVQLNDRPPVCQMGPPVRLGRVGQPSIFGMEVHAVAWIDDLSQDQRSGISDWIADMRTKFSGRSPRPPVKAAADDPAWGRFIRDAHYLIYPAFRVQQVSDGETGIVTYEYFFSCVGFVLSCYAQAAAIQLVAEEDSGKIPLAGIPTIRKVYGDCMADVLSNHLASFQLATSGPWPIVFCGYVLHSLAGYANRPHGQPHYPRLAEIKV